MSAKPLPSAPADPTGAVEPGYAEWKREKIELGLAQAKDRGAMIPAEQIWRDLGLER